MSIRRNLAWMGISQGIFFIIQFGSSVVVARVLSPYEMGVYAIALTIISVLGTINAFGLRTFVVRELDMGHELTATLFTVNAAIYAALAVLIALFSFIGGAFLREPGVTHVMLLLAITPLIGIFDFLPYARLERDSHFKSIAIIQAVSTLIAQGLTIALALRGMSYMSMAYGAVASSIFSAAAFNVVGREHVSLRLGVKDWRRVFNFGMQRLLINGVNSIGIRTSEFLLGRMVGLAALGLYSRASNLNNLAWENIFLVVGRVIFADLAAQKRQGLSLRDGYLKVIEILTALLWPTFAGLSIVAGPFIIAVYGPKWVAAAHPLAMLSVASIILTGIAMAWEVFVICGESKTQVRLEFIRSIGGTILVAIGCCFGLTTAAAGRTGEALLGALLYRKHLERMTETHGRDFVRIYLRSGILTVAAILPAAVLMAYYHASELTPLPYVLGAIALGVSTWMMALLTMRHPLIAEMRALIKRKPR